MNQQQYLGELQKALKAAGVADIDDIVVEYQQHFDNKLADGYSEEEIAAKLESPKTIAAQFAESQPPRQNKTAASLLRVVFGIAWFFVGVFLVVFYALAAALVAAALGFLVAGVVMALGIRAPFVTVPPMPYVSGLLFGIMCLALAGLSAAGALYCGKFAAGIARSYNRFCQNSVASVGGSGALLPPLSILAGTSPKFRRRARALAIVSTAVFAVNLIAGFVLSAILAGSFEFWHTWGWFV